MLLNYDFLEFENDKKVRVINDKLHVDIFDFFGIGDENDKIFLGDENDKIFLGDEISNIKDNPTELKLMLLKFMQLRALSLIECMRKLEADYKKMMAFIENSVIVKHSIKLLWINSQQIRAKRQ